MARQEIILGTAPTGLGGDPPRTASQKINLMTKELYDKLATLGTAATMASQTARAAKANELLLAGLNGIGLQNDLRGSLYITGVPGDLAGTGTTIGFADGGALGIPGMTAGTYGVLHSNCHYRDMSGAGGINQTFEAYGETWRRIPQTISFWGHWFLMGGRTVYTSNAEGESWAYADGTMMATAKLDGSSFAISVPTYRTWTFPRAFVAPPAVSVVMHRGALDNYMVTTRVLGPSATSMQMAHSGPPTLGCTFICMAFGLWKR